MSGDKIVITKDDLGPAPPGGKGFGGASTGKGGIPPVSQEASKPHGGRAANAVIVLVTAAALGVLIGTAAGLSALEKAYQPPQPQAPAAQTGPTSWCLVIDRSDSMMGEKLGEARRGAKEFVTKLEPGDDICVIDFSHTISVRVKLETIPAAGDSARLQAILKSIDAITNSGDTALWDATLEGVSQLKAGDPAKRRIMIALTDGQDNRSRHGPDDLIREAKQNNIVVNTIALGADADRHTLQRVADATAGQTKVAQTARDLPGIFRSFVPKPPQAPKAPASP